jgi:hypothetical protein
VKSLRILLLVLITLPCTALCQQAGTGSRAQERTALIERAKKLELPTKYEPPPGDPAFKNALALLMQAVVGK